MTTKLILTLEALSKQYPGRLQIITSADVRRLLTDSEGRVVGVEHVAEGISKQETGVVLLASGGFGAGASLLAVYRPDLLQLGTTNGPQTTGDGMVMGESVGGSLVDMKAVQVHPTSFVDPSDLNAKTRWLAPEALRGEGGVLIDGSLKRFANELGCRDELTDSMMGCTGPFHLLLSSSTVASLQQQCEHYIKRGLIVKYANLYELANTLPLNDNEPPSFDVLRQTLEDYNKAAAGLEPCPFGRQSFANSPFDIEGEVYACVITPAVHYCMGGIEIDCTGAVIKKSNEGVGRDHLKGLFAAGEVTGGVHGGNRLGGCSLLECVVFGTIAGEAACKELMTKDVPLSCKSLGVTPIVTENLPVVSAESISNHPSKIIINGLVVDTSLFTHPVFPLFKFAGKDVSNEFNSIHSQDLVLKYTPHAVVATVSNTNTNTQNMINSEFVPN
eukprot:GHVR01097111.1.p1 GENE.GHVR01097111.1~~GHVR01097111.1.p1  ORF type:complete len:444 (+),score=80.54 GHVR01097111.1:484-1815(+)